MDEQTLLALLNNVPLRQWRAITGYQDIKRRDMLLDVEGFETVLDLPEGTFEVRLEKTSPPEISYLPPLRMLVIVDPEYYYEQYDVSKAELENAENLYQRLSLSVPTTDGE